MLKKILLFSIVGIFAYIAFLIATLPIGVIWGQVSPKLPLRQLQLDVNGLSGTVWNGEALISVRGIEGVLGWDVSVMGLFTGQLPIDLALKSHVGDIQTTVKLTIGGGEIYNTKGEVRLAAFNPILKGQRLTLDGDVKIENLVLSYQGGQIAAASGLLNWTGGRVQYPAGRDTHENQFPPFVATLGQKADDVVVAIRDSQSSVNSIEADLDKTGMATVRVKRRLLDVANEPWPKNSSESDVVFKVRRKIL